MPESFCETPEGLLLVANGHDPVLVWDGLSPQMDEAGLEAPSAALTMSGSGSGAIVGTYYAYSRFLDDDGRLSDLSPISSSYEPAGDTGDITNASNATPIVITSAAHGLTTGATVKIAGVGGNTSANDTWAITVLTADTFSLDESSGTADYTGGGTWTSGVATISYTAVPVPTSSKVATRQILRNTDGQTDTFYVDVETSDLLGTSFSSTRTDTDMATQEAVPLLDADGSALANRHGVPPNHKSVLAHHKDRMFLAVDRVCAVGMCQVTQGSTTVTGVGTPWTTSMAGRFLYVTGASQPYEISSVTSSSQTMTLTTAYADTTSLFASYAIRPAPAERKLIYYSEAGLPQSWPAVNAFAIEEDGDELTGLMPFGSFLYILQRRSVYRFSMQADPATDGAVFRAASRGCLNNRCWVLMDDTAYLMDEEGIWSFSGGEGAKAISEPIADIFDPTRGGPYQIRNWSEAFFFASLDRSRQVARWFLTIQGSFYPRLALCYAYREERWWVESYHDAITSAANGTLRGQTQTFLGSTSRRVLAAGADDLDGLPSRSGTNRGTVTSATLLTLTDSTANFPSGLANVPVVITTGPGKMQRRTIVSNTATTLTLDRPWLEKPDSTSTYQIGGIPWQWKSRQYRYVDRETQEERRAEVTFVPLASSSGGSMDLRFYHDFADLPLEQAQTSPASGGEGVAATKGSPDLVCDLTRRHGLIQRRISGHKETFVDGPRFLQIELRGGGQPTRLAISGITVDGVVPHAGEP